MQIALSKIKHLKPILLVAGAALVILLSVGLTLWHLGRFAPNDPIAIEPVSVGQEAEDNDEPTTSTTEPDAAAAPSEKQTTATRQAPSASSSGSSNSEQTPPPAPSCPSGQLGTYPSCYPAPPVNPPSGGWALQWQDEFSGSSLNSGNWVPNEPWESSPGYSADDAWFPLPAGDLIEVSSGSLKLKARSRPSNPDNKPMQSAKVISRGKFQDFTTGYIEMRAQAPTGADLWPAFWLMGNGVASNGWPKTGEIDVFEYVNNGHDNGIPYFTAHWGPDISTHYQKAYQWPTAVSYSSMHTYGLLRTTNKLHVYIDGVYRHGFNLGDTDGSGHALPASLFTDPMHIRLSLQVGGDWADNTSLPAGEGDFTIDYIRAWHY